MSLQKPDPAVTRIERLDRGTEATGKIGNRELIRADRHPITVAPCFERGLRHQEELFELLCFVCRLGNKGRYRVGPKPGGEHLLLDRFGIRQGLDRDGRHIRAGRAFQSGLWCGADEKQLHTGVRVRVCCAETAQTKNSNGRSGEST